MKNLHPSESEIQNYALDKSGFKIELMVHIETCMCCMTKVRNYQVIFAEIKKQTTPSFSFDLSGLVLSHLPKSKEGFGIRFFNKPFRMFIKRLRYKAMQ